MNALENWLANRGIALDLDVSTALIAFGLVVAAWLLGWLSASALAPRIEAFVQNRLKQDPRPNRCKRIERVARFLIVAILLLVLFQAHAWGQLSIAIIGLNLAAASTLFINRAIRFLRMPQWAALLLSGVVFLFVVNGLLQGFQGIEPLSNELDRIGFDAGKTRVSALTVLQWAVTAVLLFALVRFVNRLTRHFIDGTRRLDPAQKLLVEKLAGIGVIVVAFFVGIDFLGIDLTALAVFSGAFGLAIGFGFQKTFGNLISGIILLMDRSIKPGDVIAVGDSFGWVNKIGVRAVSIVTRDGKEHLIPNEVLMTEEVENWSYSSKNVRVRIPVGVSYASDMELAVKLMLQAAEESPRVLDLPRANVWWSEYGESSVNFEILVWIKDPEEGVGNVRSDVLRRLWFLFKDNGIEIPFPQRDLNLRKLPDGLIERLADPRPNGNIDE
ncbi:mechanosensitive ion channel family protein [Novosphingopyxis sp.]|uniref:mechanosensitive ion channel family protein n=1 Tax=Novosphingopyxis sp. TaxID=2709690 RepID=UPI003B5C646A